MQFLILALNFRPKISPNFLSGSAGQSVCAFLVTRLLLKPKFLTLCIVSLLPLGHSFYIIKSHFILIVAHRQIFLDDLYIM